MKRFYLQSIVLFFILFVITNPGTVSAWHDETHLAVAKAAGYVKWYDAVGADITKTKAGSIEFYNHYFNNNKNIEVTPELVSSQIERYNNTHDSEGHLYGAILASLREYEKTLQAGKYHRPLVSRYMPQMLPA